MTSPTSTQSTHGSERRATSSELIRTARDRGIRVIADLVLNHTSNEHRWFQAARASPDSSLPELVRVVAPNSPRSRPEAVVFPDKENSNWAYDEQAGEWYLHRFYSHQPDLNVANAEVRDELAQVAGYWLDQGLAGFRVDAVPFLLEADGHAGGGDRRPA